MNNNDMIFPDIKIINVNEYKDIIYYVAESVKKSCKCPNCGTISLRIHSKHLRTIKDISQIGKKTIIKLIEHKYFCDNPKCERKIFTETFDFIDTKQRITKRAKIGRASCRERV